MSARSDPVSRSIAPRPNRLGARDAATASHFAQFRVRRLRIAHQQAAGDARHDGRAAVRELVIEMFVGAERARAKPRPLAWGRSSQVCAVRFMVSPESPDNSKLAADE